MESLVLATDLSLEYDSYLSHIRRFFDTIVDTRAKNVIYSLPDVLMSGLAMFILKHPSVHRFEQQTAQEKANLSHLFGIDKLCTDAQMRNILDKVSPDDLRPFFLDYYDQLKRQGILDSYRYYDNSLILALDGVSHFESTTIH
jgi:hypothetical protein